MNDGGQKKVHFESGIHFGTKKWQLQVVMEVKGVGPRKPNSGEELRAHKAKSPLLYFGPYHPR